MDRLGPHRDYLEQAWQAALAAPLSVRKAMLVALLIDAYADRLFAASGAEDVLVFRDALAAASPALALVFGLGTQRPDGPRLAVEAVRVPVAEMGALAVEDFMVSLYNDYSVQRVMIVTSDGSRRLAHEVLRGAMEAVRGIRRA